jgi:2-phospho-L-lactate guanylyltransferase
VARASGADLTSLHTIVPVRGPADGKSRLGVALDAEEREVLVLGLVARTLAVLADWRGCAVSRVVTSDDCLATIVRAIQPATRTTIAPAEVGLNGALRAARDAAVADSATAVLLLPADLPLLSVAALDTLLGAADAALAAGNGRPVVVVAPADARGGTNALLLSPPGVIEPTFGEASLEAHVRAAAAANASLQLVVDPALGFDLDTPDDLLRLDLDRQLEIERLGEAAGARGRGRDAATAAVEVG